MAREKSYSGISAQATAVVTGAFLSGMCVEDTSWREIATDENFQYLYRCYVEYISRYYSGARNQQ